MPRHPMKNRIKPGRMVYGWKQPDYGDQASLTLNDSAMTVTSS